MASRKHVVDEFSLRSDFSVLTKVPTYMLCHIYMLVR